LGDGGQEIESLGGAGDHLGQDLPGDGGKRHAVACVA
jgi:hypothetical protein